MVCCSICSKELSAGDSAATIWSGGVVGQFRDSKGVLDDQISYIDTSGRAETPCQQCIDAIFAFIDEELKYDHHDRRNQPLF